MREAPTVEEILQALGVAEIQVPAEAATAPTSSEMLERIRAKCNVGENRARNILRQAVAAGILVPVRVNRVTPMRPGWNYSCVVFVRGPKHEENADPHLPRIPVSRGD